MRKKILSLMLAFTMLCAFVPCVASAATSGICGDNLTWTLNNGTLTISGTGTMTDYSDVSYSGNGLSPWYWAGNSSMITSVVIGNGVTSIGSYAFYNCSDLTSVTIPDSVTNIGERAFYDCTGLTSVTIPDSVTNIC